NLRMAFNGKEKMQSDGIYTVENRTNVTKLGQPKKVLSVEGLQKALRHVQDFPKNVGVRLQEINVFYLKNARV
nr:protein MCM10 homolog [Tanacetum cinerariifolium]